MFSKHPEEVNISFNQYSNNRHHSVGLPDIGFELGKVKPRKFVTQIAQLTLCCLSDSYLRFKVV